MRTLADLALHAARGSPDRAVVRQCRGDTVVDTSGRDFFSWVRDLSLGLEELGLAAGDRVAVVAEGCPEWCATDLAVAAAGGVTVPVSPTLTAAQAGYIVNDSAGGRLQPHTGREAHRPGSPAPRPHGDPRDGR